MKESKKSLSRCQTSGEFRVMMPGYRVCYPEPDLKCLVPMDHVTAKSVLEMHWQSVD